LPPEAVTVRRMKPSLPLRAALCASLVAVAATGLVRAPASPGEPPSSAAPGLPPAVDVEGAIRRGVAYLVGAQNKDGSWGSPASNLWDIYAPIPGSYYAFETAVSAQAVSALLEAGGTEPGVAEAVRRGADFLVAHHGRAKR